jgi:hypothetical protein
MEQTKTASGAIARLNDHEGGRSVLWVNRWRLVIQRHPVMLVSIDAFAMKHRSPILALQQLFDDTTSTLLANFRHK